MTLARLSSSSPPPPPLVPVQYTHLRVTRTVHTPFGGLYAQYRYRCVHTQICLKKAYVQRARVTASCAQSSVAGYALDVHNQRDASPSPPWTSDISTSRGSQGPPLQFLLRNASLVASEDSMAAAQWMGITSAGGSQKRRKGTFRQ